MKVKVKSREARPQPPDTYSVTGLTRDEMRFLRDLTGRFADNPGDGGIKQHFHTQLYCAIVNALGEGPGDKDYKKAFEFTAHSCLSGVMLYCRRL